MPKHVKGAPWESLNIHFLQNRQKTTGEPFGDICEKKVSQSRKKFAQKNFGQGRDLNTFPSAWQTSKKP